jgi:hypothetical protein
VFSKLKPLLVVRTPREFWQTYALWLLAYFSAFYVVHFVWRWRGFRGDPVILPALHLLSGIGLTLAVSLRDPLRDTLEFSKFAWGAALDACFCCCRWFAPSLSAFRYLDLHRCWRVSCSSYCCCCAAAALAAIPE